MLRQIFLEDSQFRFFLIGQIRTIPFVKSLDTFLALPGFLLDATAPLSEADIAAGFALTGYFLERDVLAPHGLKMPAARGRLLDLLVRNPRAA